MWNGYLVTWHSNILSYIEVDQYLNNLGDHEDFINELLSRNECIRNMTGQTYGEKVVSQEGNSPKQEYKVPKLLFSAKKEVCLYWYNQGVGLEMAIA